MDHSTGEEAADTPPWWREGGETDSEEAFKYPSELLGTSWGSYLLSVPPTAQGRHSGNIADTLNSLDEKNGELELHSGTQKCSPPRRGILRTPATNCTSEEKKSQPHPLYQRLSSVLQEVEKAISSCGIDTAPLSHASRALTHKRRQETPSVGEEYVKVVLDALVCQSRKLQDHAVSLHHTAIMSAKSRQQFARDKQELQQMVDSFVERQVGLDG